MRMRLDRIASDVHASHSADVKNYTLYFGPLPGDGMVSPMGGCMLQMPVTEAEAATFTKGGEYDIVATPVNPTAA